MLEPLQDSWRSMGNGFVRPISPHLWIYHRRQPKHLTSAQGWICTVSQEQAQPNGCIICPLPADNSFHNQNPSIACSKHNTLLEFVCLEVHLFPNEADSKIQGAFVGKSDKAKSDKPKLYVKVQRAHDLRNMEPRLQLLTFWKIGRCEDDVVWRLWINVKEIVFNSQSATHPWATAFWACNVAHGAITINQPANHIPSTFTGRNLHETQDFGAFFGNKSDPYVVVRFGSEVTLVEPDHEGTYELKFNEFWVEGHLQKKNGAREIIEKPLGINSLVSL